MNNFFTANVSKYSNTGYTPFQIKKAYNINSKRNGNGVKVGLIDYLGNDYIRDNLEIFSNEFNLKKANVIIYGESDKNNGFNFSSYIEVWADTQWVHAVSEEAELIVFRTKQYNIKSIMESVSDAVLNGCDVILLTFQTEFESVYSVYNNTIFNSDAVFIASAGDYGAGAFFPSCAESVLSVGGTSLEIDKSGKRMGKETVWRGTGGGVCDYVDIPAYQRRFSGINELTGGKRGVPDISFFADPENGYSVYHSSTGDKFGWYSAGGTSLSAAVVAGIIANLLSDGIIKEKKDIHNWFYSLAGGNAYKNSYNKFYDITLGGNGMFNAKNGYDLCTGLGSLINFF